MRCPKCGYISFDTLGACKKCNKQIGELLEDFEGTVFEATAPSFLHIRPADITAQAEETDIEDTVDLLEEEAEESGLSLGDSFADDEEISSGEIILEDIEITAEVESKEEIEISGDIILEETMADEQDALTTEEDESDLEIDFGDIDISDLAPPETEQKTMDGGIEVEAPSLQMQDSGTTMQSQSSSAPESFSSGLEDLQVDDLDLNAPAPLVAGSKLGEKLMPSVKTGTALDDFDIDLGELIKKK